MTINDVFEYFNTYGILFLFLIIFLEHLNIPGLPAGVVMPSIGILVSQSRLNIVIVLALSVLAGVLGSIVLYYISLFGEVAILERLRKKSQKFDNWLNRIDDIISKKGYLGIFICRLIPVIRTLVSIPAGVFKMDIVKFTIYSACGIFIWNLLFILSGFFFGNYFI